MTDQLDQECGSAEARGSRAAAYVAGTLEPSARDAFEIHLLGCDACQEEVRLAAAVRGALRAPPRRRRWPWLLGTVGLAAAAVLAVVWTSSAGPSGKVRALGAVAQAPVYLGVPVRSVPPQPRARADSMFAAAMAAYAVGHYAESVRGLQAALAAGADSVPSLFFLGAGLLMTHQTDQALTAFRDLLGHGAGVYASEAHYYLAKALLRRGEADSAIAHLMQAAAGNSDIAGAATALADSVRETRAP